MTKPFPLEFPRPEPLLAGELVKRYKRFFADVRLDSGETVTAHCVNTGTMEGLTVPGTRVWLSRSDNPKRKLKFTWELAEIDGAIIGANTSLPNRLLKQLLQDRQIPWLDDWEELTPERKYGERSRVDFWMRTKSGKERFVEVKNCHLAYPDRRAYFPDTVSERASHHLIELKNMCDQGAEAEVLFFCQAPHIEAVRPSDAHDPTFAATAREVHRAGVRFSALAVRHTPSEIIVDGSVPVELEPYPIESIASWKQANKNKK